MTAARTKWQFFSESLVASDQSSRKFNLIYLVFIYLCISMSWPVKSPEIEKRILLFCDTFYIRENGEYHCVLLYTCSEVTQPDLIVLFNEEQSSFLQGSVETFQNTLEPNWMKQDHYLRGSTKPFVITYTRNWEIIYLYLI